MKYINIFLNLSAFTEAKPNLPKPSLSLIENTNQVYYIKKPLIKVTLNVSEEYSNKELPLGGFEYDREVSAVDEIINSINQVVFPKELCGDVIIDGVSVGPINTYTFTAGKHIVEYAMKDETKVVDTQFFGFDILGIESVEILDSVTSIGYMAFYNCTGLTSITIPDSVTSIGSSAFYGCSGLKTVDLTSYSKLTSIRYMAFYNCTGLTAVKLPIDITSIEDSTFRGCTGLTSITIPDSVTSIDDKAFYDCSILREVTYKGKIYTSKQELLNDLEINNVTIGKQIFDNTVLGA